MSDWDGRPQNPEQSGMHLLRSRLTGHLTGWYWNAATERFRHEHITLGRTALLEPALLERYVYEGPILTPAEVAALTQERDRLRHDLTIARLDRDHARRMADEARREGIAAAATELRAIAARLRRMDLVDLQVLANAATLEQAADALAELPAARKLTGLEYRGG